jgi:catechol 2,3-dioxygenase-like lactoylglutathione lyase family enzyme
MGTQAAAPAICDSRPVFDHVTVRVSDRGESERFYDAVLRELGISRTGSGEQFAEWGDFRLCPATRSQPVTRRLHVAFVAPSQAHVEAFWRAGTSAGYMDDGGPGPRPRYGDDYFGGFLRDPDGISVEAVHHGHLRQGGVVDHVWMRVSDLAGSKQFYETVAPRARYRLAAERDDRVRFTGSSGEFSIVAGRPTEGLQMAFAVGSDDEVAAMVDPDGNRVELVCQDSG